MSDVNNIRKPYIILTMKWGTLYCADYVNVLFNACHQFLKHPFRFVCMTDDPTGIIDGVEVFPISPMPLTAARYRHGGWPKLSVFAPDLYGLTGRALFIDLDTVIVGNMDKLFDTQTGLILIHEWRRFTDYFRPFKINGMSSIFAFTLGEQAQIYTDFIRDPDFVFQHYRTEQKWISASAHGMQFWDRKTVISFKRHLLAPAIVNRFVKPKEPSKEVSVVCFHGTPRPIDVVADNNQLWGNFMRYGRGAVPFVRSYWLKNGGRDTTL